MPKRDRLVAELREEAARLGIALHEDKGRGKGSHSIVRVGERWTTVPDRDIDPVTAKKIRKVLGL